MARWLARASPRDPHGARHGEESMGSKHGQHGRRDGHRAAGGLVARAAAHARGLARRARGRGTKLHGLWQGSRINRELERRGPTAVDPRVVYPSYRCMDEFLDLDALRALDGPLTRQVERCLAQERGIPFYTGSFKRGLWSSPRPGTRVLELTLARTGSGYLDLDDPEAWELAPIAEEFGPLLAFVATLPFTATARIMICADDGRHAVTAHRDHHRTDVCHEFLWFRTNHAKRFWVEDAGRRRRRAIEGMSAWFDTVNQFHGGDAAGRPCFSVRVDGRFDDALRARIPQAPGNPASRAALWASLDPGPR